MQLLNGDVISIHEQVQQIDSKMSGRRAECEAIAHNGNQISKIPPKTQLRGLALVRRQLQLLVPKRLVNIRSQLSSPPLPLQLHGSRRRARPDAATSVRTRGPHSPSPGGVRGAPAACMPRTVGRQALPRPQLGPSTRALAPPIVKGPAGGSAYKASAGARAARRCQSRLAIQRGRAAPANRRPGRARCASDPTAPARGRLVSPCSPGESVDARGPLPRREPALGPGCCDASALRSGPLSPTSEGLLSGIPPPHSQPRPSS